MQPDAGELARLLAAQAPTVAAELLPAGRRDGPEWRCGSLAGEADRSLGVHLVGQKAGVWADFNAGQSGDLLDLVAAVRFGGDLRAACRRARQWLGVGSEPASRSQPARSLPPEDAFDQSADEDARSAKATALFLAASPLAAGDPAVDYLAARGIDLAQLGRAPRSLRFAPAVWSTERHARLPALVAAITDGDGDLAAIHRTFLERDGSGSWRKASLANPKLSFGPVRGASVRLWRGRSGRPLREAPEDEVVAIAEGIETALSVALAAPELRVLAAVSLSNLGRVVLPSSIRNVLLIADNDRANEGARAALLSAAREYASQRRRVRIARAPLGKDFNNCLNATAPAPLGAA